MQETKGHCKHGEFVLTEGCPQCIAEVNSPANIAKRIKEAEAAAMGKEVPRIIVKVQYYSETTEELSGREYTYYSADRLSVGDIVIVPVRGTTSKAKVSAVNVPESEIEAFKDSVKTIPTGAKIEPRAESPPAEGLVDTKINLCDTCNNRQEYPVCSPTDVEFGDGVGNDNIIKCENYTGEEAAPAAKAAAALPADGAALYITEELLEETAAETALALRPGEDIEAHGYFKEAMKLLEYAEGRIIATIEDNKLANDDLVIIARLKKSMDSKRKEYLAPLKEQTEAIRSTYEYLMLPIFEAEKITESKMLAFNAEQRRIRQEQETINRKRQEAAEAEMRLKGELTESVNLVEVAPEPAKSIRTDMGSSGMVDHWTWEVVDFALLPDEYKVVDNSMLTAVARKHHDQKLVPGVRFYNEPYIATRPH